MIHHPVKQGSEEWLMARLGIPTSSCFDRILSPTGKPVLGQLFVQIATVVVGLAALVVGMPATGVTLPPVVLAICSAIVGLGSVLGIVSQGVRK